VPATPLRWIVGSNERGMSRRRWGTRVELRGHLVDSARREKRARAIFEFPRLLGLDARTRQEGAIVPIAEDPRLR